MLRTIFAKATPGRPRRENRQRNRSARRNASCTHILGIAGVADQPAREIIGRVKMGKNYLLEPFRASAPRSPIAVEFGHSLAKTPALGLFIPQSLLLTSLKRWSHNGENGYDARPGPGQLRNRPKKCAPLGGIAPRIPLHPSS